ncbi:hypothetical protein QT990_27480 [Microcoleus sp. T3_B1]|uniref:hypothetical protein n=1 Tax=Microcoleus sp. T3_B1 TaxID=3055425 RepID=UPI002FCEB9CD
MLTVDKNLKTLSVFLPILALGMVATPARAGRIEGASVSCWLLRRDKVEVKQTCIYESISWAGGGGRTLRWEDGGQTKMTWGLQGRGEKPCAEDSMSVDGVCGVVYFRHPTTLQRISEEESYKRAINRQLAVTCVQVQDKSICWLFR